VGRPHLFRQEGCVLGGSEELPPCRQATPRKGGPAAGGCQTFAPKSETTVERAPLWIVNLSAGEGFFGSFP
jgi:hypothetical protein